MHLHSIAYRKSCISLQTNALRVCVNRVYRYETLMAALCHYGTLHSLRQSQSSLTLNAPTLFTTHGYSVRGRRRQTARRSLRRPAPVVSGAPVTVTSSVTAVSRPSVAEDQSAASSVGRTRARRYRGLQSARLVCYYGRLRTPAPTAKLQWNSLSVPQSNSPARLSHRERIRCRDLSAHRAASRMQIYSSTRRRAPSPR